MRRAKLLIGAIAGVLVLAACALAYWSVQGSGSAGGKVGTLNAPTGAGASTTIGSTNVSVSWSGSTPADGVSPTGYYVKRWSAGTPTAVGGACGSPTAPVEETSCTDTGVADGTYTYTVVAVYRTWTAESSHSGSVTVMGDSTPPATTIALSPATANGSNGWYTTTPAFTLSASDAVSGVASTKYQIDGGAVQTYTGSPVSIAEGPHTVSYWSVDNAGNTENTNSTGTIKVDTVAPTSAISLGGSPSHALLSGSTLYFNSATSGSFTLIDTVGDATSGAASATFPLVTATNWTHAAQTVTTPGGGPYSSSTYSWTSGAGTPSGAQASFTSADTAGNSSATAVLTFTPDTTAPSGGSLSVNGATATPGGSTSTSTSTSFAINARTDYAETQSPGQSGLASSTLTVQSSTLTNNSCGAAGSGGPFKTATVVIGTTNPTIETGFCYVYTLTGIDNVGNAASVKTTVKVDTTVPSSPNVTLSAATGGTFISGTTVYINAQAGKEGSFKATGSSTDAESGVSSIKLPTLTGFSEGGGTLGSPFETRYKWSGAVAASGAQSATATNGLGLTATNAGAFTVTPDTTAPSSAGTVSVPARAHGAVEVTFSGAADAGSGVNAAAGELLRAEATYTVGADTCGSFGSFAKVGPAGPTSPFSDSTAANNKCYEYEYKAADNVGNTTTSSASGAVKVDMNAPKAASIAATNGTGATAHKADAKDVVTYTFNENVDPASITSAWSVGSTPDQTVTLTFKDPNEGSGTNKPDSFEVTTAGVHLGAVEMSSGNWVPTKGGSYSFSSTMHFSTAEEKAGEQKSRVTITLNSLNSGGTTVGTEAGSDTFKWTPNAAIADLAGNAADTATKAEGKAEHF